MTKGHTGVTWGHPTRTQGDKATPQGDMGTPWGEGSGGCRETGEEKGTPHGKGEELGNPWGDRGTLWEGSGGHQGVAGGVSHPEGSWPVGVPPPQHQQRRHCHPVPEVVNEPHVANEGCDITGPQHQQRRQALGGMEGRGTSWGRRQP